MLYDVVTGDRFEAVILTVIMFNMVTMMIQHYGQSDQVTNVLHILSMSVESCRPSQIDRHGGISVSESGP